MINQVLLVGRLVKTPELFMTDSGKKGSFITLAVGRPFKNIDGEYDTDFLDCTLWTVVAEHTAEYCKKGDVIGIRGRIQTRIIEENGTKYKKMEIVADKVTFLSSTTPKSDNNDDVNIIDFDEEVAHNEEEPASNNKKKNNKND